MAIQGEFNRRDGQTFLDLSISNEVNSFEEIFVLLLWLFMGIFFSLPLLLLDSKFASTKIRSSSLAKAVFRIK